MDVETELIIRAIQRVVELLEKQTVTIGKLITLVEENNKLLLATKKVKVDIHNRASLHSRESLVRGKLKYATVIDDCDFEEGLEVNKKEMDFNKRVLLRAVTSAVTKEFLDE